MSSSLKFLFALALIAITAALYWPSLHYAPFFDDTNYFQRGWLQHVFLNGFSFSPRWLPYFLTAWVDLIFEDPLFAQRCLNVGLHLATAYVLHGFIRQVADHVAPHRNNKRAAWAAALLFLLHPLAVYAVGYLIQRTILMATLFGLLALSTFFSGLTTRNKAYFLFSALFYLLSSFSKEHAVLVCVAALALTPLAAPLTRQTFRQILLPSVLYLWIAIQVVTQMQSLVGVVYEPYAEALVRQHGAHSELYLWGLSVMTQSALFFKYVGLMLVPYPGWMSIDMRVPFAEHFLQPKYLMGVLALVVYGVGALVLLLKRGRAALVGYALLAPLLLFAVEFSAVRIQEPFVLYRSYLWLAPLFLLLPAVSSMLSNRVFWVLVLGIASAFFMASSERLESFSSTYALWDDAANKLPNEQAMGAARIYASRGGLLMKQGDLTGAITDFTRALRADSGYKEALKGRAYAHLKKGEHAVALVDVTTLVRLYPEDRGSYIARGRVYKYRGDWNRARADFEYGCAEMQFPDLCIVSLMHKPEKK